MTKLILTLLALAVAGAAILTFLTEPVAPVQKKPVSQVTSWLKTDGGNTCRIPKIDIQPDEYGLRRYLFVWKERKA